MISNNDEFSDKNVGCLFLKCMDGKSLLSLINDYRRDCLRTGKSTGHAHRSTEGTAKLPDGAIQPETEGRKRTKGHKAGRRGIRPSSQIASPSAGDAVIGPQQRGPPEDDVVTAEKVHKRYREQGEHRQHPKHRGGALQREYTEGKGDASSRVDKGTNGLA